MNEHLYCWFALNCVSSSGFFHPADMSERQNGKKMNQTLHENVWLFVVFGSAHDGLVFRQ